MRLAGVLDDGDAVRAAELEQRAHLHRAPVEVDRDHAARVRRERTLDDLGREQRRLLVDVDQDRGRAGGADGLGGGDEAVGGDDDLVAGPDSEPAQGELEGRGARGNADRVLRLAPRGELALEPLDLRAEREGSLLGDPLDCLHQLRQQLRIAVVEARERHRQESRLGALDHSRCAAGAHAGARSGEGSWPSAGVPAGARARSIKTAAASLREWTPNLVKTEAKWLFTVLSAR